MTNDDYATRVAKLVEQASHLDSRDSIQIIGELIGTMVNEVAKLRTEVDSLKHSQQFTLGAIDGLLKILEQEGVVSDE